MITSCCKVTHHIWHYIFDFDSTKKALLLSEKKSNKEEGNLTTKEKLVMSR